MDYTDAIGGFGKFQAKILFVVCWRSICGAFVVVAYQLSSFDKGFWCDDFQNSTLENSFEKSQCFSSQPLYPDSEINQTVACTSWSYNTSYHETIVEEWDLVCDRSWYVSFGYSTIKLGNFLAYIPSGHFADRYGRYVVTLTGQIMIAITAFVTIFSNSVILFLCIRLVAGMSYGLAQNALLCIYLECVGPKYRDTVVVSFAGAWGLGIMIVAGIGYLMPNWRHVMLIGTFVFQLPMIFLVWRYVDESTRWLLTTQKYEKAKMQIIKQAKENGVEITDPDQIINELKKKIEEDKRKSQPTFFELFRNKFLRKRTLLLYAIFVMTVFIYHGFIVTIGRLDGSLHLNVLLMGVVELPTVAMYYIIVKFFDRRRGLLLSFLICGILFLLSIAIPSHLNWLKVTLSMIGRLCNSLAYALLYVYVAELFPTNLRTVAVSGAMTAGRIGGILSPFTDVLGRYYGNFLPYTLYGILSLITSVVFLLLPETQNKHLPDTVAESEKLSTVQDDKEKKITKEVFQETHF